MSQKSTVSVSGMTCSSCVNSVSNALSRVPGVTKVEVDLQSGKALVDGGATTDDIIAAIEKAGFGAELVARA
jgi:Cu+-exporting ATPase